jgi:hypothetical protein
MSGKEMESRRGSIEIIDANEAPTVGARSNKTYADFDMKGKPIVVEDLTSCDGRDGRDDTVDYLGSKRSGFSSTLSPEIGRTLRSPDGSEMAAADDDEDDPPSEVRWATRFTDKKVDITKESSAVHIAPPSEVKRDKIEEGLTFHNSADRPFKTEELLAKLGIGQKAQARALHRKTVLENRKAVLEKSVLRRYNAALATSQGTVGQDAIRVGSSDPIPHRSRDTSAGRTRLHAISSDDERSQKAVRAKPGRKLGREEVKRGNDLTARSDIIHIADDEVCTDLVSNSSNTANRIEDPNEVPRRDIDLTKSSSGRTHRVEGLDQTSSKAMDLVNSSCSLSNKMEALAQVHIGIKTNTQKREDDKDVDTGTENAILGEPGKEIEHDGTNKYAFDADESEQREMSMQDDEEAESRSIDNIHVDSRDDEGISMKALGKAEYVSDDSSESAVESEATSVDRHAEIEESRRDASEAKENGQDKPAVEESYKDSPLAEENNYSTAEVDEYDQDTPDLVGNSVGKNPYPEEDDLESIIAQGSFELVNANTKKLFCSGLGVHDSENVVENKTNDGGGAERNAIKFVKAKEDRREKMEQDDSDSAFGFMKANTHQKTVRVDYNDFTSVVGNSTNADGGLERFSQLVDVVDDDDKSIAGPSAINTYNRDLAISDETNSESCDLNDGREDVVLETSTPKAANKSTKEVTGVDQGNFHDSENATGGDNGNFYNSEDDNTAESWSKVSMGESMESDLEIDIEGNDVYESFAVPFVVEMLDRSCAWFEERNNAMSCSRREPSLRDKTKEWTPPAKKSTFTSRKSTIVNKKNDIPNKKRTLSPSEQAAKTFDTTAIKPQNPQPPETITSEKNATNKALASNLQPIEQDSATEISSKDARPLRRSAKNQKKKTSKRRSTKAQEESDEPDSNHFHEKMRHLWTTKRQAQKHKQKQDLNEHSEDSDRQSSAENSTASSAISFSPRFIKRSMTTPAETNPTKPDESYVRRPAEHHTKVLAASSQAAKTVETTEAVSTRNLSSRSASSKAFAETEDFVARSVVLEALEVSPYGFAEKESAPTRYIRRHVVQPTEAPVASSLAAEAAVVTEAPNMPSVSRYVFDETEDGPVRYIGTRSASSLPEASRDWQRPEQEPSVLRTTRVTRLAGGPESMVTPSRSTRRREHAEALIVLEREENIDNLQIAAAEEAIAEAFTIGYDALNETERLDAIELADRLQRRASALKRRRIQRQKKLMHLQEMQDMDDSNGTDEEPSFI